MAEVMQLQNLELVPILSARGMLDHSVDDLPSLLKEVEEEQDLGNKFMKLFIILQNFQMDEFAQEMQNQAFLHRHVFRFLNPPAPTVRLLAIVGPGNMSHNAPLDFVLFNQNVQLDYYYVVDAHAPWASVPEHDVAILALGESSKNRQLHAHIEAQRTHWPRPFLNHAQGVARCARDCFYALLKDDPELSVPRTVRVDRSQLKGGAPPYLIRPIDTHAGDGFEKIPDLEALTAYLDRHLSECFYISEFIDCSKADGLFRKFRIALIDKQPFICHYAISED